MPDAKIRVTRLSHVHYQYPNLEESLRFLRDFGFEEADSRADRTYLRGYGKDPFLTIAEQSPDDKRHFIRGFWVVESYEDLQKAASLPSASRIQDLNAPGGGKYVTATDPNGFLVGFVFGQELHDPANQFPALNLETKTQAANTAITKLRRGDFRRFTQGPSPVHKLGHYGYVVPKSQYTKTLRWYMSTLNLKPTDAIYDSKTGEDETVFCHIDLGATYTDHHSFFIAAGAEHVKPHVHHSSYEVNDIDTQTLGHDYLVKNGWTNCWGIGRHVLGSQIFDYWFDAAGNVVEHYSDGDLVNEETPFSREPAAPHTLYIWGPNIPLAFVTGRIEDARNLAGNPPDVVEGKPANFVPTKPIATQL